MNRSQAGRIQALELVGGRATAKLPQYMHRRGGMLYFKRKIPADAAEAFPGYKEQVWKSLETNLLAKAKVRLAVEVTEFNLTVAAFRRQKAAELGAQERPMQSKPVSASLALVSAQPLVAPPHIAPPSPSEMDRDALIQSLEAGLERLRQLTADAGHPPMSQTKVAKPKAVPVVVPELAAESKQSSGPKQTMLHLFEDWKQTQTRKRTIKAVEVAVMEFRALHGPVAVDAISRPMVRAYRDLLIERSLSKSTIENRIGFLSTLVRHGMSELVEHMIGNPFERIDVIGAQGIKPAKHRRPYEVWELNQIFASRLYTRGYRPRGQVGEAAFWLPLLGPFVGARIEELCQLTVADVQSVNGVWCLRICNLDDDQKLKTDSSYRRVPLHEQIIRCGFLAYVSRMAAAGHRRVFPTLSNKNANEIYSNAAGKWFGRYLDSLGMSDPRLDYHSYRYLFKQRLSLCGVESEVRDALSGHWSSKSNARRVYMRAQEQQYPFPKLVAAIKALRYDELKIEHLHVIDPFDGVGVHLVR